MFNAFIFSNFSTNNDLSLSTSICANTRLLKKILMAFRIKIQKVNVAGCKRDHARHKCRMLAGVFIAQAWRQQLRPHFRNHCAAWQKSGIFKLSPSNQTDSHEVQNFMQEGS